MEHAPAKNESIFRIKPTSSILNVKSQKKPEEFIIPPDPNQLMRAKRLHSLTSSENNTAILPKPELLRAKESTSEYDSSDSSFTDNPAKNAKKKQRVNR